jgi:arabinogalactan endo-1,4-beta-galactosidase
MKSKPLQVLLLAFLMLVTYFSNAQKTVDFLFSKGADVSWLPQMEATGYKFYDADGSTKDCLQLLKDRGVNTIRLRVWVNPSSDKKNGHCSPEETVVMAVRAQSLGMRIMINFHYSDTWADPGHQAKPAAWATHTFAELQDDVYNHTYNVLNLLKVAGVTPEWVQVGNEIPSGILFPDGSNAGNNFVKLTQLLNKGYEATKAINTAIKVIIHIDQGNNNARSRWFYDGVKAQNLKYDVIGLSYYPYWLGSDYTASIVDLGNNLKDMASRYGKEVMIVEIGGDSTLPQNTKDMLTATISAVKAVPNNKGLGVVYWEPQGARNWSGYQLSAWQNNGKPTIALDAFLDQLGVENKTSFSKLTIYPNPVSTILNINSNDTKVITTLKITNVLGQIVFSKTNANNQKVIDVSNLNSGLYILSINSDDAVEQFKFQKQ